MEKVRILQIGDMQNGFTQEDGNLYVKGAQDIIAPANDFLRRVRDGVFDRTLIILDTHFAEEYSRTEEGKVFPVHCEYGTDDWELAIDVSGLPNKRYLTKNRFDMWSEKRSEDTPFNDPGRKAAHENLFHFVDNPYEPGERVAREEYVRAISPGRNLAGVEVTLFGVASDYCNRYAMEGWLERGASVTIVQDLTKGIEKETPQVLDEPQYRQYIGSRLRAVDSVGYLRELADSVVQNATGYS
ncbi:isochorismatase family protein [Methanoculleus sp. Wushi-C6]|uniref:Isochorismatase family protein n=1 Tax=Methanoculleus caldifontis TaxID=2651577 RepID=A0ABU3WYM5_9EURY|nr:isochorismatase family protein [Methanoculleus sp. Wushi-C6]MDV2480437.1 isochorismatase family protein [Methanoculleus sp. Wushi-C6]